MTSSATIDGPDDDRFSVNVVPIDFDSFYLRTYRRALALAISMTDTRAAAEELTQDAFVEAFRRWETVGCYDNPLAYVQRVIATRSVSRWRSLTREAKAMVRFAGRVEAHQPAPDVKDERFWSAIRQLPARQRQVIALHYLQDLSVADIAVLLGVAEGTIKTQLHRARNAVAARLGATYTTFTDEEH